MKKRLVLRFSLLLNLLFLCSFLTFSYIYRDKLLQRFVSFKGHPKIVMYGNSITAQGKWVELLRRTDVINSALPGQCTYHFLEAIQYQVIDLHPKICFIMGGINDITIGVAPDKIQSNYKAILETILKNNIIPVVTLTLYEQNDPVSQIEVNRLNEFLINYCKKNNIKCLDLNQFISDSTGLKPEYATDKTHLNEKAYKVWAREIEKILKEKGI